MAGANEIAKVAGTRPEVVNAVFAAIVATCKTGDDVRIQGVGTFSKIHKEGRENVANTLKPGEFYDIEAKDVLKFKVSKTLDMTPPKPAATGRRR